MIGVLALVLHVAPSQLLDESPEMLATLAELAAQRGR